MSDEFREAVTDSIVDAMRKYVSPPPAGESLPTELWDALADAAIAAARPFIERDYLEQLIDAAEHSQAWVLIHAEPDGTGKKSLFIADWLRRFLEVES